mmetsp:Transcript_26920/g.70826  ORF Transcript_26920/g.70826 Transcript_26920/m.70826 type:complete len:84 (+) Transcript_26920:402-653(+)
MLSNTHPTRRPSIQNRQTVKAENATDSAAGKNPSVIHTIQQETRAKRPAESHEAASDNSKPSTTSHQHPIQHKTIPAADNSVK